MQIVIVGAGRMGFSLAQQLEEEGHQVVLVDRDPVMVERASTRLDAMAVVDTGLYLRSIDVAGVRDADVLVACTGSDEVNIITCILAREIGIPRHIARLQSAELLRELGDLDRIVLGVDHFVSPVAVTVERLRTMVLSVGTTESAEFADGRIVLRALLVEPGCTMTKGTLGELSARAPHPYVIGAVKRGMSLFVPADDEVLQLEDTIYAFMQADHLESFLDTFAFRKRTTARVIVFGASPVGADLCAALENAVGDTVLIDPDEGRCSAAAERLTATSVIVGSPLDQAVLEDLKTEGADYFLALSDSEEANLAAALMGKRLGVRTTVMLTSQPKHVQLFEPLPHVDSVVCPVLLSVGDILRLVREGRILSLYKLAGQRGEALEIEVQEGAPIEGRVLHEIAWPEGTRLGAVAAKGGETFVPMPETIVHAGDRLVVVSLMRSVEACIELFSPR